MGDFERVKEAVQLLDFAEAKLTRAARGGKYVCPICNSGGHGTHSSDSAFHITADGNHWECFKCHGNGDVFDLAGILNQTQDRGEQLRVVADWAGITLEGKATNAEGTPKRGFEARTKQESRQQPAEDYTQGRKAEAARIETAQQAIKTAEGKEAVAYLIGRGFQPDEIARFGFGWDAQRRRVVIPWRGADWYHIDRDVTGEHEPKYIKPKREAVGAQPLYNPDACKQSAYFIVEGLIDALAVRACGYEAVAVASSSFSKRNADELAGVASRGAGVACIMLDNDEAGREGAVLVAESLTAAGVTFVHCDMGEQQPKDAGEWLQADRDALTAYLGAWHEKAVQEASRLRQEAYAAALGSFRVLDPAQVAQDIFSLSDAQDPTPTGIAALDDVLGGGLQAGSLTVLGAVSSYGKTTFAVQLADTMAASGRGVLFVTIEQSAGEIVAKSLSRMTYTENAGGWNVITAQEVMSASRRDNWGDTQYRAFIRACEAYTTRVAPRLKILEGTRQPSVRDVEAVARIMEANEGKPPVVFIDYLQLLAPQGERDTDKQATDKNVMSLRQLARDLKTPVFVISSLNRSSYSEGVTMEAWKESGMVEYSADVLLGLQPQGIREKLDQARDSRVKREADKAIRQNKSQTDRPCELIVLKNRNGRTDDEGIPLTFKTLSALFVEGKQLIAQAAQRVI